ncbi:hypothetical protein BpHYR1_036243 [Brachionus plicatilis]|uniref:Uncharacterized protein n=1 Tax=Brachionus plicatilis TaxID=10195 RepID=A0A3M7RHJ9_BRAPC|nr:hypothetical protein BpHYR1_036243 [Brachionus plicatilis]
MSSSESILLNNPDESILDADEIDEEIVVVTRGKRKIYHPLCDFKDFERVQQSIKNTTVNATVNAKKRKLDNCTQNEENKLCSTCNMPMAKRRYFFCSRCNSKNK